MYESKGIFIKVLVSFDVGCMNMKGVNFSILLSLVVIICFNNVSSTIRENAICGTNVPCSNSQCIGRGRWCDGYQDCDDNSDEMYCKERKWYQVINPNACDETHHACNNDRCVPLVVMCDGYDDCGDQSDETISYCNPAESSPLYGSESVDSEIFISTPLPAVTNERNEHSTSTTPEVPRTTISSTISIRTISESYSTTESPITYVGSVMRHGYPRTPATPETTDYYDKRQGEFYNQHNRNVYHNNNRRNANDNRGSYRQPHRSNSDTAVGPLDPYNSGINHRNPENYGNSYSNHNSHRPSTYSSEQYPHPARTYVNSRYRTSDITSKKNRTVLPPFYFEKNYTYSLRGRYKNNVRRAEEWLINQRDNSYGWGEDTPRALIALSLITNTFSLNTTENDLMKKHLQTHLGLKLIKDITKPMNNAKLALYVNALLATCQDPRDFEGHDLVKLLHDRRIDRYSTTHMNPFVYLTLCIANSSVDIGEVKIIENVLESIHPDERSKDLIILAASAMACFHQQHPYRHELRSLYNAFSKVLSRQVPDNGFGTVYSTAIAAQALMSINSTDYWDTEHTLDVIRNHQAADGSFGDMLSTYYALPALSGRSLLHIRNTVCDPEPVVAPEGLTPLDLLDQPGPTITVSVFVMTDFVNVQNIQRVLDIPTRTSDGKRINLFDTITILQYIDPRFNFVYKTGIHDTFVDVYTIRNIPNDPERGFHWHLFQSNAYNPRPQKEYLHEITEDIRDIIPQNGQSFIYWYTKTRL